MNRVVWFLIRGLLGALLTAAWPFYHALTGHPPHQWWVVAVFGGIGFVAGGALRRRGARAPDPRLVEALIAAKRSLGTGDKVVRGVRMSRADLEDQRGRRMAELPVSGYYGIGALIQY